MEKKTINIGLDPGFGNFKICNGGVTVTSSHVYQAVRQSLGLSLNDESDDTAYVEWGDNSYFVGSYAAHKGIGNGASFGFDRLTEGGPDIRALFYCAMHAHIGKTKKAKPVSLWCALPVESMINGMADNTKSSLKSWMIGAHEWSVNGEVCKIAVEDVRAFPQPVAALFDYALDGCGKQVNVTSGRILVGSIGMNTLEMIGFNDSRIVDNQTSGSKVGVRVLLEKLSSLIGDEFSITDAKLRAGTIDKKILDAAIAGYWATVRKSISDKWGDSWRNANKVVMTGGGSVILRSQLQSFFGDKLYIPKDSDGHSGPIISIARGIYKRSLANGN